MRRWNNPLAALLAAALLWSLMLPSALAQEESTLSIRTARDLVDLAGRCTLDGWSRGKTVRLEADIDLTGEEFAGIPTFGGVFDGQGHTISGLSLTGSGNVQGLFRYLQAGAVVKNLTVEGRVAPTDFRDTVGGLVGDNRGKLLQCTFRGTVAGKNGVGGLVGCNQAEGEIVNGTCFGTVSGSQWVGGIVGQNLGSVVRCVNQGSINPTQSEEQTDPQALLQEESVTDAAADLSGWTDVGGIAGFSSGILQSCTNRGAVGYPHIGYNIGGIAGRHNGALDGCVNSGTIQGRKDVGGIVGQLEPQVTLLYNESFLERLGQELDVLQGKIDTLISHTGGSSHALSDQMGVLSQQTTAAQQAVEGLSDALTGWADQGIDQINDLSARVARTLDQLAPIVQGVGPQLDALEAVVDQMADILDQGAGLGQLGGEGAAQLQAAMEEAVQAARQLNRAQEQVAAALAALEGGLGDEAALSDALKQLAGGLDLMGESLTLVRTASDQAKAALAALWADYSDPAALQQLLAAMGEMGNAAQGAGAAVKQMGQALADLAREVAASQPTQALGQALEALRAACTRAGDSLSALETGAGHLADAMDTLQEAGQLLDTTLSGLGETGRDLADVIASLSGSAREVYQVIQELADEPALSVPSLDAAITQQRDALNDAFSGLLEEADALNRQMRDSADTLLADLQAINAQFGAITDLVREEGQRAREQQTGDHFEDVSGQQGESQTTGRISGCRNEGTVEGDLDVAGIAGAMGIDLEFDPEDDLKQEGQRSLDFLVQASAVVVDCVNAGAITGKKDDAGGIVGRMDLGMIRSCENNAPVSSTDGSYVGGVAGSSQGTIQSCWSKGALSGIHYIGGIAGLGDSLTDCRAAVEITGEAYLGAVAGSVSGEGTVQGNLFAAGALAGIDGISYQGQAEPVDFAQLCALPGVPDGFDRLTVTFTADGQILDRVEVSYGEGLTMLPQIPAKEGCSAAWPQLDYGHITVSQQVEAVYTPYVSALSDGSTLPQILVEGSFTAGARLEQSSREETWEDANGQSHTGTVWTVTVSDLERKTAEDTIHYRLGEEMRGWQLWVKEEGGWQRREAHVDGSYLLFAATGSSTTFCVLPAPALPIWAALLLVPAAALALLLIRRHRGKRGGKSKTAASRSAP